MEFCTLYRMMMIIPAIVLGGFFVWGVYLGCKSLYEEFGWRGPVLLIVGIMMLVNAIVGSQLYVASCK